MSVRLLQSDDDIRGYVRCMRTAFLGPVNDVGDDLVAWWRGRIEPDRTWSAFADDGTCCGTARTFPTTLTVPGGSVPMAAVTQVTVLPTHRRRGHLTTMMAALLADARDRDEPVAGLIAAEWPIYGRYGYGPATDWVTVDVDARRARFREAPRGSVELVDRDTFRALAPAPYAAQAATLPGAVSRSDDWWDVLTDVLPRPDDTPSKKRMRAVHRAPDGTVDGYVVYDPKERWKAGLSQSSVDVLELVGTSEHVRRDLWRFLVEIDLIETVHAWPRPVDEPLALHLVDGRAVRQRERNDQLWLAVLDVADALAARRYAVEGSLVLEVDGVRWALDGGPHGAMCAPTSAAADLVLPVATLGAAYLGGTSWRALADAGLVVEERTGALDRADMLFATPRAPFLTSHF